MIPAEFWLIIIVLAAAIISLSFAFLMYAQTKKLSAGNEKMHSIALSVCKGAMSYLKQQYKVVGAVFIIISLAFAVMAYVFNLQSPWTWAAFLTGGFFSGLCGFIGMRIAALASPRVAKALEKSLLSGIKVALRGGAVTGYTIVGFSLLDVSIWFILLYFMTDPGDMRLLTITTAMITFGMGASTQAIFARLGGGIYTKAADIGADLAGKGEYHLNEDDSRNPAVIADNVGDLVGDVAGMGADLYESYVGTLVATILIGVASTQGAPESHQLIYVFLPMLIYSVGVIASIIGLYSIRVNNGYTVKQIVRNMNNSVFLSSAIVAGSTFLITYLLGIENWISLSICVLIGMVVGTVIGENTNYYTSSAHRPVQKIVKSAEISAATVIIAGIGVGLSSTVIPIIVICGAMFFSFLLGSGGNIVYFYSGMYGIGMAAIGMLSTLGLILAMDAYGPIADNAGGNAEMSHLPDTIRQQTDTLDSVGNTTAAIGKGFAVGSAALTSIALLATYVEELRIALLRMGQETLQLTSGGIIKTSEASMLQFMDYFSVTLMNIDVLIGGFIGAMLVKAFTGKCMNSVGKVAELLVLEIRRQFSNEKVLSGKEEPDTEACIVITTRGAQLAMVLPASFAIITPLVTGMLLGPNAVMGLIVGCFIAGLAEAIYLSNAGGAWDNAKKFVEAGHMGGKNSFAHQNLIIGDTVGDPFKDTAGPSLNILIKLVAMVSIVSVGLVI